MSTMCSCCAPSHLLDWNGDLVDHGFDMPDTRETYEVHGPCPYCEGGDEDCDECYGNNEVITGTITVSIERKWGQCDCESGESVMVGHTWAIKGPGCSMSVPSDVDTYLVVRAVWPTAREPEYDAAWESERGLRIAEGWGC